MSSSGGGGGAGQQPFFAFHSPSMTSSSSSLYQPAGEKMNPQRPSSLGTNVTHASSLYSPYTMTAPSAKWTSGTATSTTAGIATTQSQQSAQQQQQGSPFLSRSRVGSRSADLFSSSALSLASDKSTQPSKPYVPAPATNEKFYYQADYRTRLQQKPTTSALSTDSHLQHLLDRKSAKEDVDLALPPKQSLYELALTPEMRHSKTSKAYFMDDPAPAAISSEDCEVTVFGFPSSAISSVITYFEQIGTVDKHELGAGNWLHIRYASSWSANKALSRNGRILPGGTFMVGVLSAREAKAQLQAAEDNFMMIGTPLKPSISTAAINHETPRVLFQENVNAPPNVNIIGTPSIFKKRPAEDDSGDGANTVVSKLVKYVFGW